MPLDSNHRIHKYYIKLSPKLIKDLKNIKNLQFKRKVVNIIYHKIAVDPYLCWPEGHGLPGIRCWKFTQSGTYYRIAYSIRSHEIILVLMAGAHEEFYKRLKRYLKNSSWIKSNIY